MKKLFLTSLVLSFCLTGFAQKKPMKEFVDDLMAKMTLQEKIGQLNLMPDITIVTGVSKNSPLTQSIKDGKLGAVLNAKGLNNLLPLQKAAVEDSRLGIPLIFGLDVIHGYETILPVPLALSCTWDIEGIEQSARIAAKEASADGVSWTFSPMVDVALDQRWGRVSEGNGEDPYLGALIAKAMVKGYQGDMTRNDQIMACVKHFALYGAVESGRDYNTVDMSHLRMYNQYFQPYKAAVEAGAGSFMTSFNTVDYIPATANRWLIDDVLRKEWNFNGFVVTDYGAIGEIVKHGLGDIETASAQALKAGTDLDMCAEAYSKNLEKALQDGLITTQDIDQACRRILEAKYKMGLFQNPYKYMDKNRRAKDIFTPENRAAARNLAAESFVLLKNQDNILPLKKQGKIALIGPLADTKFTLGTWSVTADYKLYGTLRQAMERALQGKAQLLYAQGSNICRDEKLQEAGAFYRVLPRRNEQELKAEALKIANEADVIICAMGEQQEMSGESSSRSNLELPDVQHELLEALLQLKKPVVLLNYAGRATIMKWESEHVPAIMNVWFGGSEGNDAICDVLFGDKSPSGKLTVSMPQNMGQLPLYYNHLSTGRPLPEGTKDFVKFNSNYLDVRNEALYPFGFGLSYTTFEYGDLQLSSNSMPINGSLQATIQVTNTGNYDADEVVQLYIRDIYCSIARPVKELKGFQRIHLKKGETQNVTFTITPEMLKFYNQQLKYTLEPGDFEVMVGANSSDIALHKQTFTLK